MTTRVRHTRTLIGVAVVALAASLVGPSIGVGAATAAPPAANATASHVHHVFQIVLENEEEGTSFPRKGTELDQLADQGVFVPRYFATGHASLDNYLAMVSGQAQYFSTSIDCPIYKNASGTINPRGYYAPVLPHDTGCVYPAGIKTLPDQLTAAGRTWAGYMEDMGNTAARETSRCGQPAVAGVAVDPAVGALDDTQGATAADQYAARHNPFVYFHSLIDVPASAASSPCTDHVVPMTQLATDLATNNVANWSFITPNLCDDGHDAPCKGPGAEGANPGAGGLTSANAFLAKIVPMIQASQAYRHGGLIVITFDEGTTTKSCCGEAFFSTGGGQVGAVILGPTIHPHVTSCAYNHFSLLRTWEDVFGLKAKRTSIPGSDGQGHLAHAGDPGLIPLTRELTATSNPCAG